MYREKPVAGCAHSKKGDFCMHFTFLYNGAAQREGDYSNLEEAIRSIEVGQVDRTLWSIQYIDREGGIRVYRFSRNSRPDESG